LEILFWLRSSSFLIIHFNKEYKKMSTNDMAVMQLMQQIPTDKQQLFMMQYTSVKKDSTVGVLLSLLLGGLGVHHFYMGNAGLGIVYLLFSWTGIPMILGIVEAFIMPSRVASFNYTKATEILSAMGISA
jgi:TM2 domain-containing membrane protein YozV